MDNELLYFFDKMPEALPLYRAFENQLKKEFQDIHIKVQKTQISFSSRYSFAFVSLPYRRIKGRPDIYIILSFGLGCQLKNPRIAESVEPYPGRWTHHVMVQEENEIDAELMGWIKEAYTFSLNKGRGRKR